MKKNWVLYLCLLLQGLSLFGLALYGLLFEAYAKKIAVPIVVDTKYFDAKYYHYTEWRFDQTYEELQGEEAMALKEDLASLRFSAEGFGNCRGVIYVRIWYGRTLVDKIVVDGQPLDENRIWWARRY
jgi:hypothetical protein